MICNEFCNVIVGNLGFQKILFSGFFSIQDINEKIYELKFIGQLKKKFIWVIRIYKNNVEYNWKDNDVLDNIYQSNIS